MSQLRIILVVFLILLFIQPSNALIHKQNYCFSDCHQTKFPITEGERCSDCHTFSRNSNFTTFHENVACKGCHGINNKDSFHTLHNISCSICHIENTMPDNVYSECLSCHVSGLHTTHLNKQCSLCHKEKISTSRKEIINNSTLIINNTPKPLYLNTSITNYKKFTIYEVLVNFYKQIIGDIYEI